MKLLHVFLLLFMAFIQAEEDEAVDVEPKKEMELADEGVDDEPKKEMELLDPNDPYNLALFKKQALEHEARWNAMSRADKEGI